MEKDKIFSVVQTLKNKGISGENSYDMNEKLNFLMERYAKENASVWFCLSEEQQFLYILQCKLDEMIIMKDDISRERFEPLRDIKKDMLNDMEQEFIGLYDAIYGKKERLGSDRRKLLD